MNSLKVLAFDCDGVMFDTRKANQAYYNDILTHFGRPPMTPDQFFYAQMHTVDESLASLFPDPADLQAAHALRRQTGYGPYLQYMEIEPDLKPLLDKYRGLLKFAVATNRTDTMHRVLAINGLESYFDLVVTAQNVPRPKPYPDQLQKVMDFFHVSAEELIFVGDSELDEMAAKAAGVRLVAYDNPNLAGDFHIRRLKELEGIISL